MRGPRRACQAHRRARRHRWALQVLPLPSRALGAAPTRRRPDGAAESSFGGREPPCPARLCPPVSGLGIVLTVTIRHAGLRAVPCRPVLSSLPLCPGLRSDAAHPGGPPSQPALSPLIFLAVATF